VWLKELRKFEKFSDLTGNQTLDLPACSIVPQLSMLTFIPAKKPEAKRHPRRP
jgi:hypothetical protein